MTTNVIIEEFYFRLSDAYDFDEVDELENEFEDYITDKDTVYRFFEDCEQKRREIEERINYDAFCYHQDWLSDQYRG